MYLKRRENNVYGISFRKHLTGTDMKKFNEIRDVLDREGIPYKYKVKDRLGDWNGSGTFRGTVGSAGIPADQSKQYEILVEKKDMAQAQNVIKIKLS